MLPVKRPADRLAWMAAAAMGCLCAHSAVAAKLTDAQILDLQKKYSDAYVAGDTKTLDSLLDDGLVFVHGNGKSATKAETLSTVGGPPRPGAPPFKVVSIALEPDNKIKSYNGFALVTGIDDITFGSTDASGKTSSRTNKEFCSYLWVEKHGAWKLALLHTTPQAPMGGPPPGAAPGGAPPGPVPGAAH